MSSTIKSYFERKKKDLSNKSNNEEVRRKSSESSLDLSLTKKPNDETDVFTERRQSPCCLSILTI